MGHLLPIWERLPDNIKGTINPHHTNRTLLVAGYADVKRFPGNRYIYVEHGAGQSYIGIDKAIAPYYSGGHGHRNAVGFICPTTESADRWRTSFPETPVTAVGSPYLDPFYGRQPDPRTVTITFHWNALFTGVPETASAFSFYAPHLLDVVTRWKQQGWHVIGHNHPRYAAVRQFWTRSEMRDAGVEYVPDYATVVERSAVIVADNTTAQADFLSLGRGVVWLNHPSYRRDVEHGGRYWTWTTLGGSSINTPQDLAHLNLADLSPPSGDPYAHADGNASERAASFVSSVA